jgi:hypothetical protein
VAALLLERTSDVADAVREGDADWAWAGGLVATDDARVDLRFAALTAVRLEADGDLAAASALATAGDAAAAPRDARRAAELASCGPGFSSTSRVGSLRARLVDAGASLPSLSGSERLADDGDSAAVPREGVLRFAAGDAEAG